MSIKLEIILAIALAHVLFLGLIAALPRSQMETENVETFGSNRPTKMYYLGQIDGKPLYADLVYKNWTEAQAYCESDNLTLASIDTPNEWKFIKQQLFDNIIWNKHLWTAARESLAFRTVPNMVWNNDKGTPLNMTVIKEWQDSHLDNVPYHYCGAYFAERPPATIPSGIHSQLCSEEYGVLCEDPRSSENQ